MNRFTNGLPKTTRIPLKHQRDANSSNAIFHNPYVSLIVYPTFHQTQISDFTLTGLYFPDFSRFSRLAASLFPTVPLFSHYSSSNTPHAIGLRVPGSDGKVGISGL